MLRCLEPGCGWEHEINWAERLRDPDAHVRRLVESHHAHAGGSTLWHRLETAQTTGAPASG
jgi:hypothetical protein